MFNRQMSSPEVCAECADTWVITSSGGILRFIDSAAEIMWRPPVRESPGVPHASLVPVPPKFSSVNFAAVGIPLKYDGIRPVVPHGSGQYHVLIIEDIWIVSSRLCSPEDRARRCFRSCHGRAPRI